MVDTLFLDASISIFRIANSFSSRRGGRRKRGVEDGAVRKGLERSRSGDENGWRWRWRGFASLKELHEKVPKR
jgi:hypothetical protein